MRMKHRKKYLVTYFFEDKDGNNGNGFTNYTVFGCGHCLLNTKDILDEIKEDHNYRQVVFTGVSEVHL